MSTFGHLTATVQRRPRSSVLLVGAPVLGALLGAVLALAFAAGGGSPRPVRAHPLPAGRTVAAGDLRFTLPRGWTTLRTGPDLPGFEGARRTFARSWNAAVVIALLPAESPSLLPRGLGGAESVTSARPRVVRAGALRGYHYVRTGNGRSVLDVVVVPTTRGVATIACSVTVVAPAECDRALRGLHLARGSFLAPGTDAAFLSRLPALARTLDAQRMSLRARLTGTSVPEEAAGAAARLAGAYATAAHALRPLTAGRAEATATVDLLDGERIRYGALAAALRSGDRHAFRATAHAIDRDEDRLAARLGSWQRALMQAESN
jgi:hypothetical protein